MKFKLTVEVPSKPHYVYAYYTSEGPFYIGVGTGNRFLHHLYKASNPLMRRKLEKLQKLGVSIGIKILYESDDRGKANIKETKLIAKYGRINDGGVLCNVASGGDGGDTYLGRRLYYNPKTNEKKAFHVGREPKGWLPGSGTYVGPRVCCYNPNTGQQTRVYSKEDIPKGFVEGSPRGVKTGPAGKIIISNPKTQEHKWVTPDTPVPRGWVRGRSHRPSTKGKVACHDPKTGKTKFVEPGKVPKGWALGYNMIGRTKPVSIDGKRYESIPEAMKKLNTSRYLLFKNFEVVKLEK